MPEVDIAATCLDHAERIAKHDRAIEHHDARLDAHSKQLNELREVVAKLTEIERQNQMQIRALENALRELQGKPAKRWDAAVASVITALVGGGVGYLLASVGIG